MRDIDFSAERLAGNVRMRMYLFQSSKLWRTISFVQEFGLQGRSRIEPGARHIIALMPKNQA